MTSNEDPIASTEASPPCHRAGLGLKKWAALLLAGNPFYIASAALLLLGINWLSVDPKFLNGEEAKLLFSFSALQTYELLVIAVVLILAARQILYDSTLLVVIESLVMFVPFILVTQAAMIKTGLAVALCIFGAGLVAVRFSALKNWFSELNLPGRSLLLLGLLVVLNGGIPIIFRQLIEAGGSDAWERPFQYGWLLVLPALQFLTLFAPRGLENSRGAAGHAWLPMLFQSLWVIGTGVHLWSMGFVAERDLNISMATPFLWALCWTAYFRAGDFSQKSVVILRRILLPLPLLPVLAASVAPNSRLFFVLSVANVLMLGALACRGQRSGLRTLLIVSAALAIAGLPADWVGNVIPGMSRGKSVLMGIGAFVLLHSLVSKSPGIALCGAIMAALAPACFWPGISGHILIETGIVFLLLHSLSWGEESEKFRIITAATWIVHASGWTYGGGTTTGWTVSSAAVIILSAYWIATYLGWTRKSRFIPLSATIVLCSWPLTRIAHFIESSPSGLIAVTSSFIFLGAGTWYALARRSMDGASSRS